jgi:hypothetical protein
MDQQNEPPRQAWQPPSERDIRRMATITPQAVADAIQHLRQRYPDLARKWGLNGDRSRRASRRPR